MRCIVAFLALAGALAAETQQNSQVEANPIRRVVTMLQNMEKKAQAEGEKQEAMYKKYMCYCDTSAKALDVSVADAETRIAQLESSISELSASKTQLTSELADHEAERSAAKSSIESATARRNEEAGAFGKEEAFHTTNINALAEAIPAIEKGMAGSFLQTDMGSRLRQILQKSSASLGAMEEETVTAFLQGGQGYNAQSGEIVGILKQMSDDMKADLKALTETENAAIAAYKELVAAKEKEIAAASAAIEAKTARAGETAVSLANAKNDLRDTTSQLSDDQKFTLDLKAGCASQTKNWEAIVEMRQQELLAIAETIKMLNSDDALELFKKTISSSSSSFLQMNVQSKSARKRAAGIVASAMKQLGRSVNLDFIALALRGKQGGFEKVIKMIDEMVVLLGKEQSDDTAKKEWCNAEVDKTEDSIKDLTRSKNGHDAQVAEDQDAVKTLAEEIEALSDGIKALDQQVASATAARKEAHSDFVTESANNNAALQLLEIAKNRLQKFYNPALHKAPQTPVPTEEQRQYFAATGEVPPELTPAPVNYAGKEAFVQIRAHNSGAPPPPPAALPAYKKKGGESTGVIGMMDSIINEVKSEMQENEFEEKEAQKDYEAMMADAASKRAADSQAMTDKEGAKASLEEQVQGGKDSSRSTGTELSGTKKYISEVHGDCDWLLENFDNRKSSRASEVDALKKAKAVLSGADYSLLETRSFLRKRA